MIDNTLSSLICDFDNSVIDTNDDAEWISSLVFQCNKYVSSYCMSMTYNSIDIENKVYLSLPSLSSSLLSSLETHIEFSFKTKIW